MREMICALAVPFLLAASAAPAWAQEEQPEVDMTEAIEAATEWLALIDAEEYEDSWEQAATAFQDAVTPYDWSASVESARGPLGAFGERTQIGVQHVVDPPGAPAGEYVIIQYRTTIEGERTVVETIVPMKEGDAWKVSGYFVRPE